MVEIIRIGIDTSKHVFVVHGCPGKGERSDAVFDGYARP
jgi:hypothetical protein